LGSRGMQSSRKCRPRPARERKKKAASYITLSRKGAGLSSRGERKKRQNVRNQSSGKERRQVRGSVKKKGHPLCICPSKEEKGQPLPVRFLGRGTKKGGNWPRQVGSKGKKEASLHGMKGKPSVSEDRTRKKGKKYATNQL